MASILTVITARTLESSPPPQVEKAYTVMGTLCNRPHWFTSLSFLPRWHRLDAETKARLLNENFCDELNIFLFFKDRWAPCVV